MRIIIADPSDNLSIDEVDPSDLFDRDFNLSPGSVAGLFYLLYQASPTYLQPESFYFQILDPAGNLVQPSDLTNINRYSYSSDLPGSDEPLAHFLGRTRFYLVNDNLEVEAEDVDDDGNPIVSPVTSVDGRYAALLSQVNHDPELPPNNILIASDDPEVIRGITLGIHLLGGNPETRIHGLWVNGQSVLSRYYYDYEENDDLIDKEDFSRSSF